MGKLYSIVFICLVLASCSDKKIYTSTSSIEPVHLPDDLSTITDEHLIPITTMLGDAKIIGMSEGTHGMIQPFQFRNALIKHLIKKGKISVIAIESGLIESKLMYDYVNGGAVELETVLNDGIQCTFGQFSYNRELLIWLRAYNADKNADQKVHMYGFDIPGCAPNPVLEKAYVGFEAGLDYLHGIDSTKSIEYKNELSEVLPILRIQDNAEDTLPHYHDLDSIEWSIFENVLTKLTLDFEKNAQDYQNKTSSEAYEWAKQAIVCAGQNVAFLQSIGNPEYDYAPREKGQADNIDWIMEREKDEHIFLFAHLAHLTKELHMPGPDKMPYNMCGEYLGERHGDDYKLIGNFYRKLDWFDDDPVVLEEGSMAFEFQKLGLPNFYMELDKSDTIWSKAWNFGKPSSQGKIYMYPAKSVDIIFYNDIQTWFEGGE